MLDWLKKLINEIIILVSKDSPQRIIFGRLVSFDDKHIVLSNAIYYGKSNDYVIMSILGNMFRNFMDVYLKVKKDPKFVFELDSKTYVDTIMDEISKKAMDSALPEILPLFVLKGTEQDYLEYYIPINDWIIVDSRNIKNAALFEMLGEQMKLFYSNEKDKKNDEKYFVNSEGNA